MKTKAILPTLVLLAIVAAFYINPVPVSAQDPAYKNIVSRISKRFNLPEDEVNKVFEEVRTQKMEERRSRFANKLDRLVADGKISSEKRSEALKKYDQLHKDLHALSALTDSEKFNKAKELKMSFKKWLSENGIGGFGMGKKFMM